MQYFGGKSRIASEIALFLTKNGENFPVFYEPFIGGCNIAPLIKKDKVLASDKNKFLIEMYVQLQRGWIPPENISEEEYAYVKEHKDENMALTAFIGFGCSFSGKWFGGYARNKRGDNYCRAARNSLLAIVPKINRIIFSESDYLAISPKDSLVYCDPPYRGVTQYGATGGFDSDVFWNTMRTWSENNLVIVSEYDSPRDFICVWEKKTNLEIRNSKNIREMRVEKMFVHRSNKNIVL